MTAGSAQTIYQSDFGQAERARVQEKHRQLAEIEAVLKRSGYDIGDFGQFLLWREAKNAGNGQGQKPDILKDIVSFRARQLAEIPPRLWFVEGMITPGFNMIAAKKSQGKSFLMMQLAAAIAEGREFLGRKTMQAKVLFVSFELDEADTSDRFKAMLPLSENAFLLHAWSTGEQAFADAERAIKELGVGVVMFDTFLPLLPQDPNFKINEYGDSGYYLKWRLLGKKNNAAIAASWHTGKNDREDFFLNPIGSTGMVAQADSLITIDRKRGDAAGKLFIGGNHAADSTISVVFEDGVFRLGEGAGILDCLYPEEKKAMAVLAEHPEGCTPTFVGLKMGKTDNTARATLNRLIARGKVTKLTRGIYGIATLF